MIDHLLWLTFFRRLEFKLVATCHFASYFPILHILEYLLLAILRLSVFQFDERINPCNAERRRSRLWEARRERRHYASRHVSELICIAHLYVYTIADVERRGVAVLEVKAFIVPVVDRQLEACELIFFHRHLEIEDVAMSRIVKLAAFDEYFEIRGVIIRSRQAGY